MSPRYTFDVTKCMFSPGNITEELRVASLPCSGEVLVDLYAGNRNNGGFGRAGRDQ